MENKELNESLKRYKELLGYDLEKGKRSLTERNHKPYLMEADPEGGNTDDNADFDFGDEGDSNDKEGDKGGFDFGDAGGEDTGGDDNAGFDFGDDQGADTEDNGDFDFGGEGDTEEEVDEFGTADEFSAADDLETEDGDTEEIDVTDIVKRADDAKGSAEKAVVAAEEGKNMIKDLMAKFQNLEASLSKIDNVSSEISSIKQDLQMQKPKEKLELRSLDSYPFNVKLTDYWNDVAAKGNYEITDGNEPDGVSPDGQVKVWDITPEDTKTYNATDIQKSFVPESKSKKNVLTEGFLGTAGIVIASIIGIRLIGKILVKGFITGIKKVTPHLIFTAIEENPQDIEIKYSKNGDKKVFTITHKNNENPNMFPIEIIVYDNGTATLSAKNMTNPITITVSEKRLSILDDYLNKYGDKNNSNIQSEAHMGKALGGSLAIISPIIALLLYVQYDNFITVINKNGETRRPDKGEVFIGKIVDLQEPTAIEGGTIVTLETKNGETVKFQYQTFIRANIGDTIKVKVESNFIWPTYDVKHTNESKSKKNVLTEGEKWDKFRDLMYDYYLMTKNLVKLGYEIPPFVIKAYRLRKNPEKLKEFAELWKKDMTIYMEDLVKTHPEYYFKSKLNGLLQRLKELDDITYSEFEKNPKKFSSHQQDILLGGMKVTDSGIERDLDRYKLK
jgi:hypothetical protein